MKCLLAAAVLMSIAAAATAATVQPAPIIDMHFHALTADWNGPPGGYICAPFDEWAIRDTAKPITAFLHDFTGDPKCKRRFKSPQTDTELRDQSLAALKRRNILAVTSGPEDRVEDFREHAPDRIIPGIMFGFGKLPTVAELRQLHAQGRLQVLGELVFQYSGIAPDDPQIEPYYALAEELDIPVAIHIGPGPPGAPYYLSAKYRMRLSDPLALEDVLVRHPKLRIDVMHAGWPMADRMIALMYAHPQVYVDTGIIDYAFPRAEFHAYLKRLVDAGFEKRIMFGSDQMNWPQAVDAAIEGITSAKFLTPQQKRDILYNNAARFLRLGSNGKSQ
jgi:hypothetical protein